MQFAKPGFPVEPVGLDVHTIRIYSPEQPMKTAKVFKHGNSQAVLLDVLRFADIVATFSVLGVLALADDAKTSEKLLKRFKARMGA